jgi:hypothetical protein
VIIYLQSLYFNRSKFRVFVKLNFEDQHICHVTIPNMRCSHVNSLMDMSTEACYTAVMCCDMQ